MILPTGRKIACGVRGVTCGLNWDTGTKKKPSQKIDSVSPNERKTESKAGERRASDRTFWVGTSGDFRYRYGNRRPEFTKESQCVLNSFQGVRGWCARGATFSNVLETSGSNGSLLARACGMVGDEQICSSSEEAASLLARACGMVGGQNPVRGQPAEPRADD